MKYSIALLFLSLSTLELAAQLRLPKIIDSNMVLQRNSKVNIWGWAEKNEQVTISGSWLAEPVEATADQDGAWIATLKTTDSREPQTIILSASSSEVELSNVVFGEVWLCSGQSNMGRTFISTNGEPVFQALQTITHATNPDLRLFTVKKNSSKTPVDQLGKVISWQTANPTNVAHFSAVAYFFGSQLQKVLDVPVGLIHSSWGGSDISAWMPEEVISQYKTFDLTKIELKEDRDARKIPTMLYNAMINPITKYRIRGALWYQGESNRHEPSLYAQMLPAMVESWRTDWKTGEFPFYYVQIAPYNYGKPDAYHAPDNSAFLREAQLQALEDIPNAGMVVTLDLGQDDNIHPPKKKEIGDRLLYQALRNTYGYKTIDDRGPEYKSLDIQGDSAIVTFDFAEKGLFAYGDLTDFEIAGADQVFYPAKATIIPRTSKVLVLSDAVPDPVAVRYGWSNWVMGTLYDNYLLPASSFRTDSWVDATRAKKGESDDFSK